MNKKILIVTEYFYPEEFKINEIVNVWKAKGYEVDILTQNPTYPFGKVFDSYKNSWYYKDNYNGMTVYRVKAVTGYKESLFKKLLKYFTFMFLGSVVALFIGRKYDYVFGFNMSALTGMLPAVLIKKLYKKPLTFWAQDIWPDSVYAYGFRKTKLLSFFLEGFVKFMYQNIDNIAISGKGFESKLKPYVKDDLEFHYLPNWADDLDMDMEAYEFSQEPKIHFTFAGNIGKVQNLENIIKAFSLLDLDYKNKAQLNIIGDGSNLRDLKKMTSQKNIVFHGKKLRGDMAKYFKGSDFLIVSLVDKPIFSVTVPAKTQTYIAAKKPILAVINGEAAQLIQENNLGYTAKADDIFDIKETIIQCIDTDEKTLYEFTENCELLTSTTFNKDKIIESLLQLTMNK